jgi:hypothetical protein
MAPLRLANKCMGAPSLGCSLRLGALGAWALRNGHGERRQPDVWVCTGLHTNAAIKSLPLSVHQPIDRFLAGRLDPRSLTARIKLARNTSALEGLWACYGTQFNHIHLAAALSRLVRLVRDSDASSIQHRRLASIMLAAAAAAMLQDGMRPRETSTVLWAAACLDLAGPHGDSLWLSHMAEALPGVLLRGPCMPQDAGMALWALARLGYCPSRAWLAAVEHVLDVQVLDAQALANVGWALAVMTGGSSGSTFDSACDNMGEHQGSARLGFGQPWVEAYVAACAARASEFTGQGHATALWAAHKLLKRCSALSKSCGAKMAFVDDGGGGGTQASSCGQRPPCLAGEACAGYGQ